MKKAEKNWKRNLERLFIISTIIMAAVLANILKITSLPMTVFFAALSIILFINFWLYEKSGSGTWFALPLFIMAILMLQSILSLIGWILKIPVFKGFWADLFAWPSFIAAILITVYCIALLDNGIRHSIINFLKIKKYPEEDLS